MVPFLFLRAEVVGGCPSLLLHSLLVGAVRRRWPSEVPVSVGLFRARVLCPSALVLERIIEMGVLTWGASPCWNKTEQVFETLLLVVDGFFLKKSCFGLPKQVSSVVFFAFRINPSSDPTQFKSSLAGTTERR